MAVPSVGGLIKLAAMLAVSASAQSTGWQLQPKTEAHGPVLTFDAGNPLSYRFECAADNVIVTETGVTKLTDLKTGQPIGDDAQAVMPSGAAMMALTGGQSDPQFITAEAVKNAARGWDLTIRIPKGDKRFAEVGKAEIMSLFTTGYTMVVAMNGASRAKWNDFVQRCRSSTKRARVHNRRDSGHAAFGFRSSERE